MIPILFMLPYIKKVPMLVHFHGIVLLFRLFLKIIYKSSLRESEARNPSSTPDLCHQVTHTQNFEKYFCGQKQVIFFILP